LEARGHLVLADPAGRAIHVAAPAVVESLRRMVGRTRLSDSGGLPQLLGVTSTVSGEGVSFMCRSLALVLVHDTLSRVCLVDLNWNTPSTWLGPQSPDIGAADVIRGSVSLETALMDTSDQRLSILPAGVATLADRPALANGPELEEILLELRTQFDHVLLDLPAIGSSSEAFALAGRAQSVVMVVSAGVCRAAQVQAVLADLGHISVLGVIINRTTTRTPRFIRHRIQA
jgi:Mrp family chromosome partitioning ATPase